MLAPLIWDWLVGKRFIEKYFHINIRKQPTKVSIKCKTSISSKLIEV